MAKKRVWRHSNDFRRMAVERFNSCENIVALAKELGIQRRLLYKWREDFEVTDSIGEPLPENSREGKLRKDHGGGFFQRRLAESRGSTLAENRCWREDIYNHIRDVMSVQGGLSIEQMCRLADVSRSGFYRSCEVKMPVEDELRLRALVQEIALGHRLRYGYRRVAAEVRRRGIAANHKRIARIMRADNLLNMRPLRDVGSRNPGERFEVYLNLAARMKVTGPNQLWVADITYVRLSREFVYLAVVLDAFSRKVVGWELDRTLATRLPLAALRRAIEARRPLLGLVHHSDQGVQYASGDYRGLLQKHGMFPSVSRPGTPLDNASCESFMRTLKREEIQVGVFQSLEDLRKNIETFIDRYYNGQRLHSALGYKPPDEYESSADGAALLSKGAILNI